MMRFRRWHTVGHMAKFERSSSILRFTSVTTGRSISYPDNSLRAVRISCDVRDRVMLFLRCHPICRACLVARAHESTSRCFLCSIYVIHMDSHFSSYIRGQLLPAKTQDRKIHEVNVRYCCERRRLSCRHRARFMFKPEASSCGGKRRDVCALPDIRKAE